MGETPLFKDWTIIFNVVYLLVVVVNQLGFIQFVPSQNVTDFGIALAILVNIALRLWKAQQPVTLKKLW